MIPLFKLGDRVSVNGDGNTPHQTTMGLGTVVMAQPGDMEGLFNDRREALPVYRSWILVKLDSHPTGGGGRSGCWLVSQTLCKRAAPASVAAQLLAAVPQTRVRRPTWARKAPIAKKLPI
jgi:hypothetical protein